MVAYKEGLWTIMTPFFYYYSSCSYDYYYASSAAATTKPNREPISILRGIFLVMARSRKVGSPTTSSTM